MDANATPPHDPDPQETREWLDALSGVLEHEGPDRAHFLIESLIDGARLHDEQALLRLETALYEELKVR